MIDWLGAGNSAKQGSSHVAESSESPEFIFLVVRFRLGLRLRTATSPESGDVALEYFL